MIWIKKQRVSTISTFIVILLFAFLTVSYALIKGPSDIYSSLNGEDEIQECVEQDLEENLACLLEQEAAGEEDHLAGFYKPENIANYVDVPGVSGKLFGLSKKSSLGISSFVPSGATTLALLSTPIITDGGDDGNGGGSIINNNNDDDNNGEENTQTNNTPECNDNEIVCNGQCILAEATCEQEIVLNDPNNPGNEGGNNNPGGEEGCEGDTCATEDPEVDPVSTPEPTTMLLFGTGLAGAALRKRFQA